jgi:hypothetical protein
MLCDKRNVMRELITKIMVSKKIFLFRKKFAEHMQTACCPGYPKKGHDPAILSWRKLEA